MIVAAPVETTAGAASFLHGENFFAVQESASNTGQSALSRLAEPARFARRSARAAFILGMAAVTKNPEKDMAEKNGEYLSPSQVCALLPPGRGGAQADPSTVIRWILRGCTAADGRRVKLHAIRAGCRWAVAREALGEFFDALAAGVGEPVRLPRTPTQRARASARAKKELAAMGV